MHIERVRFSGSCKKKYTLAISNRKRGCNKMHFTLTIHLQYLLGRGIYFVIFLHYVLGELSFLLITIKF